MLKQLAVWVLQARHRLTIAVAFLLIVPLLNFVAPMVAVAGVLQFGPLAALPWIAGGWGLVGLIELYIVPDPMGMVYLMQAGPTLAVALLLGTILGRWQSLTLALQAAAIGALGLLVLFYGMVGDATAYWTEVMQVLAESARGSGSTLSQLSDAELAEALAVAAPYMAGIVAGLMFLGFAVSVLGGYAIWDHGADEGRARFGRFRDLNLGRALAALLVALAVVGTFGGWVPGANAAIVLLIAFGLHGCALAHWLRRRFDWPEWSLVVFYALLVTALLGSPLVVMLVCVAGYVDAWFNMVRAVPPGSAR